MENDRDLKGNIDIRDVIDNLEKDYDCDNKKGRSYSHEERFYSMGRFINIMKKCYGDKIKSQEMTFSQIGRAHV